MSLSTLSLGLSFPQKRTRFHGAMIQKWPINLLIISLHLLVTTELPQLSDVIEVAAVVVVVRMASVSTNKAEGTGVCCDGLMNGVFKSPLLS